MANGLPIDIETFRRLQSQDAKLDALFDVLVYMHSAGYECEDDREKRLKSCEKRFTELEKRKTFDTGLAGGTGIIGGAIVWFIKWFTDK
jgi:hypothetical protein